MPGHVYNANAGYMTAAATLLLNDKVKAMQDPDMKKRERNLGFIPRNQDSPFGDFPADMKPKNFNRTVPARCNETSPRSMSLSPMRKPLHKGEGKGGLTSSLLNGRQPEALSVPKAGAYRRRKVESSDFRRFYDRGDLPVSIDHFRICNKISWKMAIDKLDYHHALPIFFDGLRESEEPYRFLAVQGVEDLLEHGGAKILPVVPQLIIPIKTALNTRDHEVIATVLKVMQQLVLAGEHIGKALVPYYRQLLPVFNLFKNNHLNTGDSMDYSQRKRLNLGGLIDETLEIMELHGGSDAFINIKYMIPTYESCVMDR